MNFKRLFLCLIMFSCTALTRIHAQGMMVPQPLNNLVYDAMVGEWTGESDMMGTRMTETMSIRWGLGHQFLVIELHAVGKNNPAVTYDGMGLFGQDEKGNAVTWWFDSMGPSGVSTGTGTFTPNKLEIKNGNAKFTETRSFEVKEGVLYSIAKGTMTMNGKETNYNLTTVYTKK